MSLGAAKPLEDYTESEWDAQLFRGPQSLAAMLGWRLRYHVLRSRGSQAGFPDRVLVRDRIVYVETKSQKGKPSAEQVEWLDALVCAGAECYLWRPSDLEEASVVLSGRWTRAKDAVFGAGFLYLPAKGYWTPNSLWIPGAGRSDGT